jgi:hypothetical protein
LKDAYVNIFPAPEPDEKRRLQAADTVHDVASLFYSALDRGMRVRFKVRTLFKHEDDDDAPSNAGVKDQKAKDDDDDRKKEPDFFDVWTTFDDCG